MVKNIKLSIYIIELISNKLRYIVINIYIIWPVRSVIRLYLSNTTIHGKNYVHLCW